MRKINKTKVLVSLLLIGSILSTGIPAGAKKTTVKVKTKKIQITVGSKKTIQVTKPKSYKVTYKSGKPGIASVSKKGVVTGKKAGNTKVKVTIKRKNKNKYKVVKTANVTVKVVKKSPGATTVPVETTPAATVTATNPSYTIEYDNMTEIIGYQYEEKREQYITGYRFDIDYTGKYSWQIVPYSKQVRDCHVVVKDDKGNVVWDCDVDGKDAGTKTIRVFELNMTEGVSYFFDMQFFDEMENVILSGFQFSSGEPAGRPDPVSPHNEEICTVLSRSKIESSDEDDGTAVLIVAKDAENKIRFFKATESDDTSIPAVFEEVMNSEEEEVTFDAYYFEDYEITEDIAINEGIDTSSADAVRMNVSIQSFCTKGYVDFPITNVEDGYVWDQVNDTKYFISDIENARGLFYWSGQTFLILSDGRFADIKSFAINESDLIAHTRGDYIVLAVGTVNLTIYPKGVEDPYRGEGYESRKMYNIPEYVSISNDEKGNKIITLTDPDDPEKTLAFTDTECIKKYVTADIDEENNTVTIYYKDDEFVIHVQS